MFKNRTEAGLHLAERLAQYSNRQDVIVLALPRGGVPVAYQVAQKIQAPLDVFLVRKLGVPWNKELAMGAIAMGGIITLNDDVIAFAQITRAQLDAVIASENKELLRRDKLYRANREPLKLKNKIIILIDDGVATGSTLKAAISALKKFPYQKLIVAVPVGAPDTIGELETLVDDIVCLATPEPFYAIGSWYVDFSQTTDEEVIELLRR